METNKIEEKEAHLDTLPELPAVGEVQSYTPKYYKYKKLVNRCDHCGRLLCKTIIHVSVNRCGVVHEDYSLRKHFAKRGVNVKIGSSAWCKWCKEESTKLFIIG